MQVCRFSRRGSRLSPATPHRSTLICTFGDAISGWVAQKSSHDACPALLTWPGRIPLYIKILLLTSWCTCDIPCAHHSITELGGRHGGPAPRGRQSTAPESILILRWEAARERCRILQRNDMALNDVGETTNLSEA